ncbi:MAG: orotidine-5'-phosphate decarboxylase [Candidatus Xiphinematobacter sp.]|nr:MAG: orotidine-5'-phosphate decarboxylase [Candidatus Xiphinematobacter sp.]QQY08978.1 MAG: orotidine-5'-phosphate decarboxylase [Candidatus Xiphinematobacter sp.]QQY10459.1 MAG: orotidine-5'-phosphate decarboxylase [Candidatus Xiphinematobacter sp.]QQY11195.1 MAG: orotidine-5'-phosphate decarboxylase [Candidatus Xiphinematobacter sp.]
MHSLTKTKIAVALDVHTLHDAIRIVEMLRSEADAFKVGLQLFMREGPEAVQRLKAIGVRVFLDLKFHDIPNTVAQAVAFACALGADLITVHLCGGADMLAAAAQSVEGTSTLLVGVSVLTSCDANTLTITGISSTIEEQVIRLASLAVRYLRGGVVASPLEILPLRNFFGNSLQIVTPGIRPTWASGEDDQRRLLTPFQAAQLGADWLVIGRPIITALSPLEALLRIKREIMMVGFASREGER